MPDWKMIKTLLRAYAQLDGVVPFRETQPAVVSQAAAPFVNSATQAVGAAVSTAPESVQDLAAVVAGSGRFVGFSLTGLVDLIGPIAQEDPLTALQRISKTILNGTFSLTTRAALFGINGVPGESRYERGVAATEFGLSVLATVVAAENIIARPRPPSAAVEPLPFVSEFAVASAARVYAPAMGVAVELPKLPPHILMMAGKPRTSTTSSPDAIPAGRRKTINDDEVIAVLKACHGNQSAAAKQLGIGVSSVNRVVSRLQEGDPLKPKRRYPEHQAPRGQYDALVADLAQGNGNQKRIATAQGTSVQNISQKLRRAQKKGVVGAADIRPKTGRPALFTDDELVWAMGLTNYVQKDAAGVLRVTSEAISRRWKLYKISDLDMLLVLREFEYDVIATAHHFKIRPADVLARIRNEESTLSLILRVADDGTLLRITHVDTAKVVVNRNGPKLPNSPYVLKAVYFQCGGHVDRVAEFFGVTRQAVYLAFERLGLSTELPIRSRRESAASGEIVRPLRVTLDELAELYVAHRYNWKSVADAIGRAPQGIYAKISNALVAGELSILRFLIEVQRRIVVGTTISDNHIASIIIAHRFDLKRSAAFLAMTPDEVVARVRAFNPKQSPLVERVTPDLLK